MQKVRMLDFLVIGSMKSGTTSLHKYLLKHKDIYLPPEKEAPFFSEDAVFKLGYSHYFNDFFRDAPTNVLLGTVTPMYMRNPISPQRIKDTCPNIKLIAILRDPIERAYSHYQMAVRINREKRTFEEAVVDQLKEEKLTEARSGTWLNDYVSLSEYGRILKRYYELFPHENIKIKFMSELEAEPKAFISDLFDYLGLKNLIIKNFDKKYHGSKINILMSIAAHITLNTKLSVMGKLLLPNRMRRRIRFWLGLHRSSALVAVDSRFIISDETREQLENLYLADSQVLSNLTGEIPQWIANWQRRH